MVVYIGGLCNGGGMIMLEGWGGGMVMLERWPV